MNINYSEFQILQILRALDLKFDEKNANDDGWLSIKSPLRSDKTPSFGLNVRTGGFRDFGDGHSGNIYELVKLCLGVEFKEAVEWIDQQLGLKPARSGSVLPVHIQGLDSDFWDAGNRNLLREAQEELKRSPDHYLVEMIGSHDRITYKTLVEFGCGITASYIDGAMQEVLLIPYPTGAQLYTRGDGKKTIRMLQGSKPRDSFFGEQFYDKSSNLIIAKSPREAMLIHQIAGQYYDVLGLNSGELSSLSDSQQAKIRENTKLKNVIISMDRDTDSADQISMGFAQKVADVVGSTGITRLLNYKRAAGPGIKDFTDFINSGRLEATQELLAEKPNAFSDVIISTYTSDNRFWCYDDKRKLKIDEFQLIRRLQAKGFSKFYSDSSPGAVPILVKQSGQLLFKPSQSSLNDFIRDELICSFSPIIEVQCAETPIYVYRVELEALYVNSGTYKVLDSRFSEKFKPKQLNTIQDDSNTAHLFYSNVVVKVTADNIEVIDYDALSGTVWDQQRLERAYYRQNSTKEPVFSKFVDNTMAKDPERIRSLRSHIGYLTHTYKARGSGKAVVFADENLGSSLQANGGTGKGIVSQAISNVSKVRYLSGKQVDTENRFMFMDVEHGDAVLCLDDVRPNFNFSSLFTAITDHLAVERKGQNRFVIPYSESPKVLITTNTAFLGSGSSYDRRTSIVDFSHHYSASFTPADEFGHTFFEDWDTAEWSRFDGYIIGCIQEFLKSGLTVKTVDRKRAQLCLQTDSSFVEWAEEHLETDVEYEIRKLFRGGIHSQQYDQVELPVNSDQQPFPSFLQDSAGVLSENQMRKFKQWLDAYREYKGWNEVSYLRNGYDITQFKE